MKLTDFMNEQEKQQYENLRRRAKQIYRTKIEECIKYQDIDDRQFLNELLEIIHNGHMIGYVENTLAMNICVEAMKCGDIRYNEKFIDAYNERYEECKNYINRSLDEVNTNDD